MALLHLLAQPAPGPVQERRLVRGRHDVRRDRRPAARQLGEDRRVQVAVDGHRDRTRDRRRGHHEHVRRHVGLGPQRVPLLDAEPVLLVHDDQAEIGEVDALVEQRVRADDDAGTAALDLGEDRRAGPPRRAIRSAARCSCRSRRRRVRRPGPSRRASPPRRGNAGSPGPRSGPAARPARRRRRPAASRAPRTASCRSRPRPAAAGASGSSVPDRWRSPRRPRAGRRSAHTAARRRTRPAPRRAAAAAVSRATSAARRLRCTSVSWTANASSHFNRFRAAPSISQLSGRWICAERIAEPHQAALGPDRVGQRILGRDEHVQRDPYAVARSSRSAASRPPGRPGSAPRRTPRSRSRPGSSSITYSGKVSCRVPRKSVTLPANMPHRPGPDPSPARCCAGRSRSASSSPPEPSPTVACSIFVGAPHRPHVHATDLRQHRDLLADRERPDLRVLAALVVPAREVVDQVADGMQIQVSRRAPSRCCRRPPWKAAPTSPPRSRMSAITFAPASQGAKDTTTLFARRGSLIRSPPTADSSAGRRRTPAPRRTASAGSDAPADSRRDRRARPRRAST